MSNNWLRKLDLVNRPLNIPDAQNHATSACIIITPKVKNNPCRYARNNPACMACSKEQYEETVYLVALTWLTLLADPTSRTLVLLRNFTYISFFCQSMLLKDSRNDCQENQRQEGGKAKINNSENKIITLFGPFENETEHGALQYSIYPPLKGGERCLHACNKNKRGHCP